MPSTLEKIKNLIDNDMLLSSVYNAGVNSGHKKPFLVSWDRGCPGFNYHDYNKVMYFIDSGFKARTPVNQVRVVLWGGSAVDLRGIISYIVLNLSLSNSHKSLLVIELPTNSQSGAAAIATCSIKKAATASLPNSDNINIV
ncbi:hypothetical protein [Azospirillum agricola]|uniref:hypothetical protein n=1 Tax=Azospirillum agricola TaxID=1720247 RepID=UPI0011776191|nr:hypothetical protein [Azospirillum agricola]